MNMIDRLIENDRFFELLFDRVRKNQWYDEDIKNRLFNYLDEYLQYSDVQETELAHTYTLYMRSYNSDIQNFLNTGKYPTELNHIEYTPSRVEYSLILLFSIIMAPHRMRIMQLLRDKVDFLNGGRTMFIGCGPGFEIDLIDTKSREIVAFDLDIDPFLVEKYRKVDFRNQYFDGNTNESFNGIFLIELLEHLSDPFELLENCCKVLDPNGLIYLTTATNMPQFDHVYNFEVSHSEFEKRISEMSLEIAYKEDILHNYIVSDIESQNCFYILKHLGSVHTNQ